MGVVACVKIPNVASPEWTPKSEVYFRMHLLPKKQAKALAGGFPGENTSYFSWLGKTYIPVPDEPRSNRAWGKKLFNGIFQAAQRQEDSAAAPAAPRSIPLQRVTTGE